jgi:hypothetical protein
VSSEERRKKRKKKKQKRKKKREREGERKPEEDPSLSNRNPGGAAFCSKSTTTFTLDDGKSVARSTPTASGLLASGTWQIKISPIPPFRNKKGCFQQLLSLWILNRYPSIKIPRIKKILLDSVKLGHNFRNKIVVDLRWTTKTSMLLVN